MITSVVCNGPAYRKCRNIVDAQHAFVGSIARIGGHGPMTAARLIDGAVCDDCARHLERKGIQLFPLADALAAAEERERRENPNASLGELLTTSSLFQASRAAAAHAAAVEKALWRKSLNEQSQRLIAAARQGTY